VGVHPLSVGRWKRDDDWPVKLAKAQAKGPEKARKISVRKQQAHDKAFKAYLESGGKISNRVLADQVGVSAAGISSWKASESWGEKLEKGAKPLAAEIAPVEAGSELPPALEMDEKDEIEIDVDALAYPDHISLLNRQIDELLGRGLLSPVDLKTIAEANEAVLQVVIAYPEVLEMISED